MVRSLLQTAFRTVCREKKLKMLREIVLRAVFRENKLKMLREIVLRAVFRENKLKMLRENSSRTLSQRIMTPKVTQDIPFSILNFFKSIYIKVNRQSMLLF